MSARGSRLPLVAACALVAWFYVWTARSDNLGWRWGREQTDYYNLLVDGFLRGQLSLAVDVDPALLAVADPYDPAQRPPGVGLHDATFFGGRYYIYFGVVPAALVLLPFRVVTGIDLPLDAAVLALVLAGFGLAVWLLADVRRRFFPSVGPLAFAFVILVLGFASGTAILIRRASMYDLPIASGYCFSTLAFVAWYCALMGARRPLAWIALSSLCWGLAIGSRPIYLVAPLCLFFAWRFFARDESGGARPRRELWRWLAAAVAPIACVGVLLALYNYLRYGSVTEFGLRYVLSGVYESKIEKFRPRYAPWNLHARFFASGEWSRYFPFLPTEPALLPRPRQHYGMDFAFPVLVNLPFLWLAALVPLAWRAPANDPAARAWRLFLASVAWAALTVTGFVLCFYATMARYIGDFGPGVALLAAIGALAGLAWVERRRAAARVAAKTALGALGAFSILTLFVFSVTVYDRVRPYNPAAFHALARIANAPVHALESDADFGAANLEVMFPADAAPGRWEELVVTGRGGERDRVLVSHPDAGHVQFAFEHAGAPRVVSEPVSIDRPRAHTIRVALGSLFPPTTHPFFQGRSREAQLALARRVEVALDGKIVLERYQRFHPAGPRAVAFGGEGGERFSGRVLRVAREGLREPAAGARFVSPSSAPPGLAPDGTFHWRVRFPGDATGRREPLIVSGETNRGDLLSVEYLAGHRLRFVLDHWGRSPYVSAPLDYEPGREYRVAVAHPFYATNGAERRAAGEGALTVSLDGRRVWECEPLFYPIEREDVYVGHNPIGGSLVSETFTGTLRADAR